MSTAAIGLITEHKAGLELRSALEWKAKPGSIEFSSNLRNSAGGALRVIGQVTHSRPHRFKLIIHDKTNNSSNLFRLCIRGEHVNRRTDGARFTPGSHLHVWHRLHGDHHACQPWEPWPLDPWDEAGREELKPLELKALFAIFCQMMGIRCDLEPIWTDPPPRPSETFVVLPNGEEIP